MSLTPQERRKVAQTNLERANANRLERGRYKRKLREAPTPHAALELLAQMIDVRTTADLPVSLARACLDEMLCACYGIQTRNSDHLIGKLRERTGGTVRQNRRLGDLTDRERLAFIEGLRYSKLLCNSKVAA